MEYKDVQLEHVQSYPYLGVEISANGSFKPAAKCMSTKAQKAIFKLKSLLAGACYRPTLCIRLFDQLIKPICVYGSEIWGIDEVKVDSPLKFARSSESFTAEKLNLSFSKFSLGVHKKAQNSAVRGELGRMPLGADIAANILCIILTLKC